MLARARGQAGSRAGQGTEPRCALVRALGRPTASRFPAPGRPGPSIDHARPTPLSPRSARGSAAAGWRIRSAGSRPLWKSAGEAQPISLLSTCLTNASPGETHRAAVLSKALSEQQRHGIGASSAGTDGSSLPGSSSSPVEEEPRLQPGRTALIPGQTPSALVERLQQRQRGAERPAAHSSSRSRTESPSMCPLPSPAGRFTLAHKLTPPRRLPVTDRPEVCLVVRRGRGESRLRSPEPLGRGWRRSYPGPVRPGRPKGRRLERDNPRLALAHLER